MSKQKLIIIAGSPCVGKTTVTNDHVSFNELQVVNLYEAYISNPDKLEGMLLYDDGIVKGVIKGFSIDDNGFFNSGEMRIIEGTTKDDCRYEYVLA